MLLNHWITMLGGVQLACLPACQLFNSDKCLVPTSPEEGPVGRTWTQLYSPHSLFNLSLRILTFISSTRSRKFALRCDLLAVSRGCDSCLGRDPQAFKALPRLHTLILWSYFFLAHNSKTAGPLPSTSPKLWKYWVSLAIVWTCLIWSATICMLCWFDYSIRLVYINF